MKIGLKMLGALYAIILVLIVAFAMGKIQLGFLLTLVLWIFMIFYAFNNMKERSMLFAFLIAFFVFLLGRDMVQQFFGYQIENFDIKIQNHAWFCFSLSLVTIGVFYKIFSAIQVKKNQRYSKITYKSNGNLFVRKVSLILYYVTWLFAIISKIVVGRFVSSYGYTDYYTDYSEYLSGNTILYLISKIELIMPVAWCIYLATRPEKRKIRIPIALYIVYLIISLGTGQRSTTILGLLFLFVYFVYRNGNESDEKWITKGMIFAIILLIPFLAVFVSAYSIWREGGNASSVNFFNGIMDFFYGQGVTSSVVKRAYMYQNQMPNQIYTLEFLHSGILARIFNIPVYHGNTIEHAMHGGSFTHSLGYVVLGTSYLAGRGTGSCYIAELYQDFGYVGVFWGNIIYAYLFVQIANVKKQTSVFKESICFLIITQLLWAPRGSFTYFISQNLAPTTIVTYVLVFGSAYLYKNSFERNSKVSHE